MCVSLQPTICPALERSLPFVRGQRASLWKREGGGGCRRSYGRIADHIEPGTATRESATTDVVRLLNRTTYARFDPRHARHARTDLLRRGPGVGRQGGRRWIIALDADSAYRPPAPKIVPRPASPALEKRLLGHFKYGFIDTAQLTFAPDGAGRAIGTAGRQGCQCTIRAFSMGLPANRQGVAAIAAPSPATRRPGRRQVGRQRRRRDAADNKRVGRDRVLGLCAMNVAAGRQIAEMLTSADVVTLTEARLPAAVVLAKIAAICTELDTSVEQLVTLSEMGVNTPGQSWRSCRPGRRVTSLAPENAFARAVLPLRRLPRELPIGYPGVSVARAPQAQATRDTATHRTLSIPVAK